MRIQQISVYPVCYCFIVIVRCESSTCKVSDKFIVSCGVFIPYNLTIGMAVDIKVYAV